MTREIINKGSSANDGTGDTLRSFATKTNNNFSELYNILGGDSAVRNVKFGSNQLIFDGASLLDAHETTLAVTTPTQSNVITFPDSSGDVILTTAHQTLTNKKLVSPTLVHADIYDSAGANNHYELIPPTSAGMAKNISLNIPTLVDSDTFVFNAHTATLTNKTLTSPVLTTAKLSTSLNDTNGNELIKVTATGSAVNEITLANAAAAGTPGPASPSITATGGSTHIGLKLVGKGTGSVELAKAAFSSATITSNGTASTAATLIICNKSTALAVVLDDGTTVGEYKIFTNKNSGAATVTPANFAQGTSFALAQNDGCQCVWDGAKWFLVGNQGEITIA
tara:strand:- start:1855 stop:2868 length:1014 start_codon:yes stop_codon:yes gene_type:complete